MDEDDHQQAAIAEGKKSVSEAADKPFVGVVIVKDGEELGRSYRGRTGSGEHAEYGLLKELRDKGVDVSGATVYTTLEPCSSRNHPKKPCAAHLIEAGVEEVVIGMYDPNPRIFRDGWRMLREAGIGIRDFDQALRAEIAQDNEAFADLYRLRRADTATGALYDWVQLPGGFRIFTSGGEFTVKFSAMGADSIYLLVDGAHRVGHAKYARDFSEIDDPTAQDSFQGHFRALHEGDIGILTGIEGSLLLKIVKVDNMDRGADQNCVVFNFEYRAPK